MAHFEKKIQFQPLLPFELTIFFCISKYILIGDFPYSYALLYIYYIFSVTENSIPECRFHPLPMTNSFKNIENPQPKALDLARSS